MNFLLLLLFVGLLLIMLVYISIECGAIPCLIEDLIEELQTKIASMRYKKSIKIKDYYMFVKSYRKYDYYYDPAYKYLLDYKMQPFVEALINANNIGLCKLDCTIENYDKVRKQNETNISFYEYYWKTYCTYTESDKMEQILCRFLNAAKEAPDLIYILKDDLQLYLNSLQKKEKKKDSNKDLIKEVKEKYGIEDKKLIEDKNHMQ